MFMSGGSAWAWRGGGGEVIQSAAGVNIFLTNHRKYSYINGISVMACT